MRKIKEKLEDWLAAGYAIETRKYVKCLIQAGVSNVSSFGFSSLGIVVGIYFPFPGSTAVFSILFGIIGYILTRWGSGFLINVLERSLELN